MVSLAAENERGAWAAAALSRASPRLHITVGAQGPPAREGQTPLGVLLSHSPGSESDWLGTDTHMSPLHRHLPGQESRFSFTSSTTLNPPQRRFSTAAPSVQGLKRGCVTTIHSTQSTATPSYPWPHRPHCPVHGHTAHAILSTPSCPWPHRPQPHSPWAHCPHCPIRGHTVHGLLAGTLLTTPPCTKTESGCPNVFPPRPQPSLLLNFVPPGKEQRGVGLPILHKKAVQSLHPFFLMACLLWTSLDQPPHFPTAAILSGMPLSCAARDLFQSLLVSVLVLGEGLATGPQSWLKDVLCLSRPRGPSVPLDTLLVPRRK